MKLRNRYAAWIVAVAVIAACVLVRLLPTNWTVIDTSASGIITLSDETRAVLKNLDQNVEIRFVAEQGNENKTINAMLERYADMSSHITFQQIQGTQEEYDAGNIVVVTDKEAQTIGATQMYEYNYASDSASYSIVRNYMLEKAITSAIYCLTSEEVPVFYQVTNHDEIELEDFITSYIQQNGIKIQKLDLSSTDIPSDAAGIIIASPTVDITGEEAARLSTYLENDGYLMLFTDVSENEMPNLSGVLAAYGLEKENGLIVETNTGNMASSDYPYYLIPNILNEELSGIISQVGFPMVVMMAHGIQISEKVPDAVTVTSLLESSAEAYMKMGTQFTSLEQGSDDPEGPFLLAVSAQNEETGGRIDWYGSSSLLAFSSNEMVNNADIRALTKAMQDVSGAEGLNIGGKAVPSYSLKMGSAAISKWSLLLLGLPLVLVLIGLVNTARKR